MGSPKLEGGNQNDKRALVGIQETLNVDIQSSIDTKELKNRFGEPKKGYEDSYSSYGVSQKSGGGVLQAVVSI